MLTDKEKFDLANDLQFGMAINEAEWAKNPLQRYAFNTIGGRIRLIEELEKAGFQIIKTINP